MQAQIQPLRDKDIDEVVSLLRCVLVKEDISASDFCRRVILDPNFRPEGAQVAYLDGRVVGFFLAIVRKRRLEDGAPDFGNGWITLMAVHPNYQRRGIGTALLQKSLAYLKSEGAVSAWVSPYAPNYFCPGIDEAAYSGGIAFLNGHGFRVAYRPLSMEASLHGFEMPEDVRHLEAGLESAGVAVREMLLEDALPLIEFVRNEFPGDWQRLVRESIDRIVSLPEPETRIFVAMKDGLCLGFARHDGGRFGPFGVGPAARGMGIGGVLLFRCLESMERDGMQRVWLLWTDDRAARLYMRAGFHETRRYSVMKCEL